MTSIDPKGKDPIGKDPVGEDPIGEDPIGKDPIAGKVPGQALQERKDKRDEKAQARDEAIRTLEAARPPAGYIPINQPPASPYAERLKAARENTAAPRETIDALGQIADRLADARHQYEEMKAVNAILREHKGKGEKAQADALKAKGMDAALAALLVEPREDGGQGFCSLGFQREKIRHIEARMAVMLASVPPDPAKVTDPAPDPKPGEVTINEDKETDRLQIVLPSEPNKATRKILMRHGFRPAGINGTPSGSVWDRPLTDLSRAAAQAVLERLK